MPAGGTVEVIEEGVNGWTGPVGDANALAKKIQAVLEDDAARERVETSAREKIKNEFTLEIELEANLQFMEG